MKYFDLSEVKIIAKQNIISKNFDIMFSPSKNTRETLERYQEKL